MAITATGALMRKIETSQVNLTDNLYALKYPKGRGLSFEWRETVGIS